MILILLVALLSLPVIAENLALNLPVEIAVDSPDTWYRQQEQQYADPQGVRLTDGVIGQPQRTSPTWVGYQRQEARRFTLDLGEVSTIHELRMHFLHDPGAGISFPPHLRFYLSLDGENWERVADLAPLAPREDLATQVGWMGISDLNHQARYVLAEVYTDVWVFVSEFEVMGERGAQPGSLSLNAQPFPDPGTRSIPQAYSEAAAGMHHQVLIYSDPAYSWSRLDFFPYAGYMQQDYTYSDWMFDSFLFLPLEKAPSGRAFHASSGSVSNLEDWVAYLDFLFIANRQLHALDQTIQFIGDSLGDDDHKGLVSIALPYPSSRQTRFGDLGQGMINFNHLRLGEEALENRVHAVGWFMDQIMERWEKAGFERLELVAFYWIPESLPNQSPYEVQLIQRVSQEAETRGKRLQWIPYHTAIGIRFWEELGFGTALMQPNYFFVDADESRLRETARLARRYGLGMEMEFSARVFREPEYRRRYYEYLDAFVEEGFANSHIAYYQEVKVVHSMALHSDPRQRILYDDLYDFIKGNYQPGVWRER